MRWFGCLLGVLFASSALATPVHLAHQGRIVDSSGGPLNGEQTFQVQLFTDPSVGSHAWTRTYTQVPVDDGYYALVLDGGTPTLDSSLFTGDMWMQITVGGQPMGGRQPLHHIPQAAHALSVSGGDVIVPVSPGPTCATPGALYRDATTGAVQICQGSAGNGQVASVLDEDAISALIAAASGTGGTIGSRIGTRTVRSDGDLQPHPSPYQHIPGLVIPFQATGGALIVTNNVTLNGGSHSTCSSFIDGTPVEAYTNADTTYFWSDGLEYSNDGWAMWNVSHIIEGVSPGRHTMTVRCQTDGSTSVDLGSGPYQTASVIPLDADTGVLGYSASKRNPGTANTNWVTVPGLSTPFTALGGHVRLTWSVPMRGGSHSTCRPLIDGAPAGGFDGDDTGYRWQEGLTKTNDNWAMYNRTRLYDNVPAGEHVLTLQCTTDSGTVDLGNGRMTAHIGAVPYPPNGAGSPTSTARAVLKSEQGGNHSSFTAMSGLTTTLTTLGGPVEIGVSIPMSGGSTSWCHPTLDGSRIIPNQPDNPNNYWNDGLVYTADGWALFDRIRVYENIPAGTYTLGAECRSDSSATHFMGVRSGSLYGTSTVWGVSYAP